MHKYQSQSCVWVNCTVRQVLTVTSMICGPINSLACPQVYFSGPPVLLGLHPTPSHGDDFSALQARAIKDAICVWPVTLSPFLPPDNLMVRLEGLVLAPPCGGDLPRSVMVHFAAKWTMTLPIVVAMQVRR